MGLSGYYKKSIYRNEKDGYNVFSLETDTGMVTAYGTMPVLSSCTPISVEGEFDTEGKYKGSFRVEKILSFESSIASDVAYMVNLPDLNINSDTAKKVRDALGESVFSAVENAESMADFKAKCGLDAHKAQILYNKTLKALTFKELLDMMQKAGGYYAEASKIFGIYEDDAISVLKKNPYKICYFASIPFETADKIGADLLIDPYDDNRIEYLLMYAIDEVMSQGSVYARVWEIRATLEYIQKKATLDVVDPYLCISKIPTIGKLILCGEDKIYYRKDKEKQDILVSQIKRIYNSSSDKTIDEVLIDKTIKASGYTLSKGQRATFNALSSEGIKIITGGPGRGKTTIINLLIDYITKREPKAKICLMAPTGCAAQKMAENSSLSSETIHSRLGIRPFDGQLNPTYDQDTPLPYQYFIIDEYSMADLDISSYLFSAIPNHATVIIVGDPDQLPSVGAGNVLNDMIDSGLFEVYELTDLFRQSDDSVIVDNAEIVRGGHVDFKEGEDFHIKSAKSADDTVSLCKDYLKGVNTDTTQVLCPIKRHGAGTRELNAYMQSLVSHSGKASKSYGIYKFYEGDRVITVKNNRESNYFNGEPGIIKLIDDEGMLISFLNGDEAYIKNCNLDEVLPAKALTIHKSQGNEYNDVVLLITEESQNMLSRQILYTAITRAKKDVYLFCQDNVLKNMREDRQRNSDLDEMLMDICING